MSGLYQIVRADGSELDQEAVLLTGVAIAGQTKALGTVRVQCLGSEQAGAYLRLFVFAASGAPAAPETDQWVQARVGAGSWTALGGADDYLALTIPALGGYVDVELQMVVPGDLAEATAVAVHPHLRYR